MSARVTEAMVADAVATTYRHWTPEDFVRQIMTLEAALSTEAEGWQPTHRHKKRGSEYHLLGVGKMQASRWFAHQGRNWPEPVDMREVAVYSGSDGQLWVRPVEEFNDGRFETLPAAPLPEDTREDKP